jgi:hypothetical protein
VIQHQIRSIGPGQSPPPRRPEASGSILRPGDDATAIGGKGDGEHSLAVAPQSPRGAGIPAPTGGPLRLCRPSRSAFPQTHAVWSSEAVASRSPWRRMARLLTAPP